jgi:putative flippase GtrA
MRDKNLARQIFRFIVVGVINTGLDLLVLNGLIFLTHKGRQGFYYTFFKTISFVVAITNSYFMNKYWTFVNNEKRNEIVELSEFVIVSLVGFVINVGVATLVVKFISIPPGAENLWPTFGALCGTVVGLVWNFFGYKLIVFEKHKI